MKVHQKEKVTRDTKAKKKEREIIKRWWIIKVKRLLKSIYFYVLLSSVLLHGYMGTCNKTSAIHFVLGLVQLRSVLG
jgi:hypothetical protein